jgi:hypothetical protein
VLAEEQALKLVVSVLANLRITLIYSVRLGEFLVVQRVNHALLVLKHSFHDIIFVDEENIAESALSGFTQA